MVSAVNARFFSKAALVALRLFSVVACGDDAPATDAGPDDAGPRDAGPNDASPGVDAGCADIERDPLHCGACDHACSSPENASPTCSGGTCGFDCNAGFDLVVGSCAPRPPPRPIAPMSTATATSRRPTFRWELAPRNDGARIEVCADRACTSVITTIDTEGDHGRPTSDLPAGVVFWRLYGRNGDDVGHDPSVTWQLYIRSRSAPVDTSWGTVPDVNGDGFADLLRAVDGVVHIHHGMPTGLSATPTTVLTAPPDAGPSFGASVSSAGDVNGDGFADVIVGAPNAMSMTGRAYIFYGGIGGLGAAPSVRLVLTSTDTSFGTAVRGVGDTNLDGYADVVVQWMRSARVHLGSPAGSELTSSVSLSSSVGDVAASGTGDFNADGFGDVVVTNQNFPSDAGSAAVHFGGPSGLNPSPSVVLDAPDGLGSFFGAAADSGDVDGDGYADVVVGTHSETSVWRVYVYAGGATTVSDVPTSFLELGTGEGGYFGSALAASDFDGDGFDDIAVGSYYEGNGAVRLFLGATSGIETTPSATRLGPSSSSPQFGRTTRALGDVNADGFNDLVVPNSSLASSAMSYVFLGASTGLSASATLTLGPP